MAKTVKFNLICDGNPVRTIDDLRDNFSIEDVLMYYNNRLLHRWLSVRGYSDLLKRLEEIHYNDSMEIIKSLITLFEVEEDVAKVEESVYILQYKKEREELLSIYKDCDTNTNAIIEDHQTGYVQLVDKIVDNANDIAVIRAAISEMINNYYWILEIDHNSLFYKLYSKAPMAIFVMLTHEETRKFYLPQKISTTNENEETDISKKYDDSEMKELMEDKKYRYERICELIPDVTYILEDNLLTFSGVTDGYWKDLENGEKKYMIISMQKGNYVRSAGRSGEEFGYSDIENRFLIIDGIDYKSNNATHELLYMEV